MALTVIPDRASSTASARVKPTTPCLLAQYAEMYGAPPRPAVLATLTMRPHRAPSMSGTDSRVQRNVPVRLVAIVRFHISVVVRAIGADSAIPALLTRIAIGPY